MASEILRSATNKGYSVTGITTMTLKIGSDYNKLQYNKFILKLLIEHNYIVVDAATRKIKCIYYKCQSSYNLVN